MPVRQALSRNTVGDSLIPIESALGLHEEPRRSLVAFDPCLQGNQASGKSQAACAGKGRALHGKLWRCKTDADGPVDGGRHAAACNFLQAEFMLQRQIVTAGMTGAEPVAAH